LLKDLAQILSWSPKPSGVPAMVASGIQAEYLLERGADLNWIGWDDKTALDVVDEPAAPDLAAWLRARGAKHANQLHRRKT